MPKEAGEEICLQDAKSERLQQIRVNSIPEGQFPLANQQLTTV